MNKAVIITDQGVQDEEYIYPYYRLQEAYFTVDIVTISNVKVHGKYGIPITATIYASDLSSEKFDVVILPGGWEAPERVRQNELVLQFLRDMNKAKKPIGAICHGPSVLISANIVRNRKMTCYKGMKDDLINAGAYYLDQDVVIDENIVTAPHYKNNPVFLREFLKVIDQHRLANLVL